ncbi:MAG: tRNA pseudouridine(38-40) synthase TruA [Dethiosulfatibacter sp.]|nr:tRNA pseudouridine(38-40) synthase TruA [Dethiosulfatibacter sp.]
MKNFMINIQYDGGRYKGWQRLGGDENTIQSKIETVLSKLLDEKIEIIGCSRTDAGVHAYDQVANFKSDTKMTVNELKDSMNRYLPTDISIKEVRIVDDAFHSRFTAKTKTYVYKIWNGDCPNPFVRKYSLYIDSKLDLHQMTKAAKHFLGEHDFTAFTNAKSKTKSMVREIQDIDIEKHGDMITIRITGNGFLHNMVRKIVGVLIETGLGTIKGDEIPAILSSKERSKSGMLADACGLYLDKIIY